MARYSNQAYALLRIVSGFLFMWHGLQKLFHIPMAPGGPVPAHITYIAGPIELVGGSLIMIGLYTRSSAFICSGLMAAAYWSFHALRALIPLVNKGELAILFCFIFLFIAATGPGIWSADEARGKA